MGGKIAQAGKTRTTRGGGRGDASRANRGASKQGKRDEQAGKKKSKKMGEIAFSEGEHHQKKTNIRKKEATREGTTISKREHQGAVWARRKKKGGTNRGGWYRGIPPLILGEGQRKTMIRESRETEGKANGDRNQRDSMFQKEE